MTRGRVTRALVPAVTVLLLLTAGCAADVTTGPQALAPAPSPSRTSPPPTVIPRPMATRPPAIVPTPLSTRPPTARPAPSPPPPRVVEVRYRVERRVADSPEFAAVVDATLHDSRGWQRAGFRLVEDPRASYVVMLVEPDEAQERCRPYDVYRKYSCQNGPLVVLNADRWRNATKEWTGTLAAYRQMLVNHEVGHLLGRHHPPAPQCPGLGVRRG